MMPALHAAETSFASVEGFFLAKDPQVQMLVEMSASFGDDNQTGAMCQPVETSAPRAAPNARTWHSDRGFVVVDPLPPHHSERSRTLHQSPWKPRGWESLVLLRKTKKSKRDQGSYFIVC